VIIKGEGTVTIEGKNKKISQGDTIIIPKTSRHRIENTGNDKLIFIEVQTGTYFGEDDIVRLQDDFNRA
jgi:mannose-6-phosphate isomerase-like protein (cupin superfamily)